MNDEPQNRQRSRENTLAVALAVIVGGIILFFLYVVSLGVVGNVLMGAGLIAIVGALHYLLWGRSLSEEVAAEREYLRRRDAQAASKPPPPAPDAIQDLTRTQGIKEN